jgi:MoaA/NifB/PqqE/SkfB family radical SAM enzyme
MNLEHVRSLALEITSHCNIRCPQCSRIDFDGNIAEFIELKNWNTDVILQNLNIPQLTNLKFVRVEGDNGDALMHPEFERIIDAFYQAPSSPNILILTNGSMRSEAWWEKFGARHQDRLRVQFSIDGLADTHKLYRVGADYEKTIKNARAFLRGGGDATTRCLIFDHNQHQLAEIKQSSLDVGFNALHIQPGDASRFHGMPSWPVFERKKKTHYIMPVASVQSYSAFCYNNSKSGFGASGKSDLLLCNVLNKGEITVTYKGHLIPCCMYHADLYFDRPFNDAFRALVGDLELVDLNKRSLVDILSDPMYYGHRLEEMLASGNLLPKCDKRCGTSIRQRLSVE